MQIIKGQIYETDFFGRCGMTRMVKVLAYPLPSHYVYSGLNIKRYAIVQPIEPGAFSFLIGIKDLIKKVDAV